LLVAASVNAKSQLAKNMPEANSM